MDLTHFQPDGEIRGRSRARVRSFAFALCLDVDGQNEWIGDLNSLSTNGTGTLRGSLTFIVHEDFRSYLRLDLTTSFHKSYDVKTAQLTVGFDALTNTSSILFTRFKNFNSDMKGEWLRELDPDGLTATDELYVAEVHYEGPAWASNVFGFNDLGESNRLVQALRIKLLQPGTFKILVSGGKSVRKVIKHFNAAVAAQRDFHHMGGFYTKKCQGKIGDDQTMQMTKG